MGLFSTTTSRNIYYWSLAAAAISMPLSVFTLTLAQLLMLLNWIFEEKFVYRWRTLKATPSLWFIGLFYIVHLLGLLFTCDFTYAAHDLKIKLPFLIIPLVIGTSVPVEEKWIRKILVFFISGVVISSFVSTYYIIQQKGDVISHLKQISPFVSHIRLSLMVAGAVFSAGWLITRETRTLYRLWYGAAGLWLFLFFFMLQAFSGILIFFIISALWMMVWAYRSHNLLIRWFTLVFVAAGILLTGTYLVHFYAKNFLPRPVDTTKLDQLTSSGNHYSHGNDLNAIESGHYTYLYRCDKELRNAWNQRSHIPFDSTDRKGEELKYVIYRYMTSMDLRKDSAGMASLSARDIRNIENGIPNKIFTKKFGFGAKIYGTMWELHNYFHGSNPSGYSTAQRIEYLKTAAGIIKRHFWTGTGTGDVVIEFKKQYELDNSPLSEIWRLRAHNQFVTFFLTFGVFGFLAIMLAFFIPPALEKKYNDFLFLTFFLISIFSMLNEDTLETHAGISFVAFFYALFLYDARKELKPAGQPFVPEKEKTGA